MTDIKKYKVRKVGFGTLQIIVDTPTNYIAKWYTINISNLGGILTIDVLPEGGDKHGKIIRIPDS
jgi:hypothetical protein